MKRKVLKKYEDYKIKIVKIFSLKRTFLWRLHSNMQYDKASFLQVRL